MHIDYSANELNNVHSRADDDSVTWTRDDDESNYVYLGSLKKIENVSFLRP